MENKSLKSHFYPSDLQFAVFSSRDIKKLSATKVIAHYTYDQLGNAIPGGLYDLAMGPASQRDDPCKTCLKSYAKCPGHIGHIDLCMLTFNPFFMSTVHKMLRILCLECFKTQISERIKTILKLQLRLVDAGYIGEAQNLEIFKTNAIDNQVQDMDTEEKLADMAEQREYDKYYEDKMRECEELLINKPSNDNRFNSQNIESFRMGLIDSVVKVAVKKKCIFCKSDIKKVISSYGKLVINVSKSEMLKFYKDKNKKSPPEKITSVNKVIIAEEARSYLRKGFEQEADAWQLFFPIFDKCSKNVEYPVDVLFMDVVPVIPPNVRPPIRQSNRLSEHVQTNNYKDIIFANTTLKSILAVLNSKNDRNIVEITKEVMDEYESHEGQTGYHKMLNAWQTLQNMVDATMNAPNAGKSKGLKQIIERKEGLIRQNMMGKRVNYAARTVITPDPNINVDEIGIPETFARKLTFPTPVTPLNVKELRKFVENGPDVHPGANYIEYENGNRVIIPTDDETKRASLAKLLLTPNENGIKIVHRHVLNGDPLILNRQPSLHRPSMQGHKARILKGEKTFRMHYSNCKAYNADFDGDEMNAHFPQNHLARSEAFNIVNVANNFLVPKDGTPLGGLIQDHMIAGVRISMRGRFFSKEDYHQLVYQGLSHVRGKITLLPPTILKPAKLWSGKQIFSTIIINVLPKHKPKINLNSKAKINANAWEQYQKRFYTAGGTKLRGIEMSEAEVVIRNGELLVGVLDKMHYGSTPYSLVHCIYEIYGGDVATQLLSSLTRCFTLYLQWTGFTLGVRDILVLSNSDKKRKEIIDESRQIGFRTTAKALEIAEDSSLEKLSESLEAAYATNPNFRTVLDRTYKSVLDSYTNEINQTCLPAGLLEKFPNNNLQLMVQSGAKGSTVNTMQISCLLGQIELEGKRPPLMISGKALPSFAIFETSPKSGGFIDGRFMTGIQPQDFFFHCMAGREGLIDTAVKTSRSGYLQRCLIKHLEGLNVNYDLTVRDSDNSVIQFLYGEDGMDVTKAQFLKPFQMDFLYSNSKAIVDEKTLEKLQNSDITNKQLRQYMKKLHSWGKKHKNVSKLTHHSPFQQFSKELRDEIQVKKPNKIVKSTGRRKIDDKLSKLWRKTDEEKRETYCKQNRKCPDPIVSKFRPDNIFGSVSENMLHLINDYIKKNPTCDRNEIEKVMYAKNIISLACPGEPVGLLAAQSIGEPSTQMTLNTFHFAGRGEMNVTLGIPRLREILMMASKNIKTPSMDIPFLPVNNLENVAEKLRLRMIRVTLADVLEKIDVKSCLKLRPYRARQYNLRFQLLPYDGYGKKFCVKPKYVLKYMTDKFFKLMFRAIIKAAKSKSSLVDLDDDKSKRTSKKQQTLEDFQDQELDAKEPEPEDKKLNDESSDDEDNANDGDASDDRRKMKQTDECDYEDPEEDEIDDAYGSENGENYEEELGSKDELDEIEISEDAANNVVDNHELAESYIYDKVKHSWCEITFNIPVKNRTVDLVVLLKEVAKKAVIWETPNIKRAITYSNKDELTLKTEGINIIEMFKYSKILNINRLYTNDIHAVSHTYGIEAARDVIVKEVENVFNVYGIRVDPRHLFLIADYMTFSGSYKPLNRSGMETSASPLQQMSFETSLKFLTTATVQAKEDSLQSPSSRLIVGQPCRSGTGAFSLITDYNLLQTYLEK